MNPLRIACRLLWWLILWAMLCGCVSEDRVGRLEKKVADLEKKPTTIEFNWHKEVHSSENHWHTTRAEALDEDPEEITSEIEEQADGE